MARITGITVRWDLSPRLITIAAPLTEITIQDLIDTLREIEQRSNNIIYPHLIKATGKESLGGGVFVGLTAELQNAQINFEARYIRTSSGVSEIDGGIDTIIFTDGYATFITDGVERGATITNFDDQSFGTVIDILSETTIIYDFLNDGYANIWAVGDSYKIHNEIQCEITGGNLVAVDGYGNDIEAISPTAFVQIVRTSASSATLTSSQLQEQIKHIIESLRGHHTGTGDIYFWDPINGNDTNDGLFTTSARKTFQSIHDNLVVNGNHDTVYLVSIGGGAGPIVANEFLNITKSWMFLRGPGRDIVIRAPDDTNDTIIINATGVAIESVRVETQPSGTPQCAIEIENASSFAHIKDCWIEMATDKGICINNGDHHVIADCVIHNCSGTAVGLVDSDCTKITKCEMHDCDSGVILTSTGPGNATLNILDGNIIRDMTTSAIEVGNNVSNTVIRSSNYVDPALSVVDSGTNTHDEITEAQALLRYNGAIFINTILGIDGAKFGFHGTEANPVQTIGAARILADRAGIKKYNVLGTLVLDQDHNWWTFGWGGTIDVDGYSVAGSTFNDVNVQGDFSNNPVNEINFSRCWILICDNLYGTFQNCRFKQDISVLNSGQLLCYDCSSALVWDTQGEKTFTFGTSSTILMHNWHGRYRIDMQNAANNLDVDGSGFFTFDSACTAGKAFLRGDTGYVDESGGAVTIDSSLLTEKQARNALIPFLPE